MEEVMNHLSRHNLLSDSQFVYPFKNIFDFTTAGDWDC